MALFRLASELLPLPIAELVDDLAPDGVDFVGVEGVEKLKVGGFEPPFDGGGGDLKFCWHC